MPAEPARIDNDVFFGNMDFHWPPRHLRRSIPADTFFVEPPPPAEASFVVRAASDARFFGGALFVLGWIGILFQRSFLRQLVVGAPVFEEFAKFGLALLVVSLLGLRSAYARVPFGWASGAAFGVMEHFLSYVEESTGDIILRVVFHGAACGLSMAAFSVLEALPDVRGRWASTLTSTVLHWANNFGVTLGAIAAAFFPVLEPLNLVLSALIIAAVLVVTVVVLARPLDFRKLVELELRRIFPPLGEKDAFTAAADRPPEAAEAAPAPGGPHNTAAVSPPEEAAEGTEGPVEPARRPER